jgi:hypothetical protein
MRPEQPTRYNASAMKASLAVSLLLVIGAIALVWINPNSGPTASESVPVRPIATPLPAYSAPWIPTNFYGALLIAAADFLGPIPPLVGAHVTNITYVETTLGEASQVFGHGTPQYNLHKLAGTPVWAFVASGDFQYWCMGCHVHLSPVFHTIVVLMTRDWSQGPVSYRPSDEHYDLNRLGTPVSVPLSVLVKLCQDSQRPQDEKVGNCGFKADS